MLRPLAVWVAALAACALLAVTAGPAAAQPRAVLAFLPAPEKPQVDPTVPRPSVLDELNAHPELSLGLSSATQGRYDAEQALLDITQGTRTSAAAYDRRDPGKLDFVPAVTGARLFGWPDVAARAKTARAEIIPGLLGSAIPGGVAYVGVSGREQREAVAAADRDGRIPVAVVGPADAVADTVTRLLRDHRLVVAGLATGDAGDRALRLLIKDRAPDDLLIVMQTPPHSRAPQLLPTGVVGLGGTPRGLTSSTTHQEGLVAGIDVSATILDHLGLDIPKQVKGQSYELEGRRSADDLTELSDRLRVIAPRRFPALETMLATWLAVLLACAVFADRRGVRAAQRIGALAFCWLLPVLLVTAWLAPSRTAELAIVALGTLGLAVLTDLLVAWPRAIGVPCAVAVVTYVVDLARGSDLIVRSLLGPNPRFGSRFYGIGNELEATLPLLLFIALAVALHGRGRSRASAAAFGVAGLLLTAAIGSGRLGADVGGVLTIGAGTAVCVLLMLPGGVTRRALVLALLAPAAALVGLAALDLATGGDSHFTRTVLHADGEGALWDIVSRRYTLAFNVLRRGLMPFATGIAILAIAYGVRYRHRIYAPLAGDAAWQAALWGGLAAGVAGTLFNDSGPLLLLFSAFVLSVVSSYVRGGAPPDAQPVGPGEDRMATNSAGGHG
jgi:hypothetical protein